MKNGNKEFLKTLKNVDNRIFFAESKSW